MTPTPVEWKHTNKLVADDSRAIRSNLTTAFMMEYWPSCIESSRHRCAKFKLPVEVYQGWLLTPELDELRTLPAFHEDGRLSLYLDRLKSRWPARSDPWGREAAVLAPKLNPGFLAAGSLLFPWKQEDMIWSTGARMEYLILCMHATWFQPVDPGTLCT